MDPDVTLKNVLNLANSILQPADLQTGGSVANSEKVDAATQLAELVVGLHAWLSRGGLLPKSWL